MARPKKSDIVVSDAIEGTIFTAEDMLRIKTRYEGLTTKQRRWFDAYMVNRNQSKSAQIAGYGGSASTLRTVGHANFKALREVIEWYDSESVRSIEIISDLNGIYKFWGTVLTDTKQLMKDRLKASELLGRALGAFDGELDAMNRAGTDPYKGITEKELKQLARLK